MYSYDTSSSRSGCTGQIAKMQHVVLGLPGDIKNTKLASFVAGNLMDIFVRVCDTDSAINPEGGDNTCPGPCPVNKHIFLRGEAGSFLHEPLPTGPEVFPQSLHSLSCYMCLGFSTDIRCTPGHGGLLEAILSRLHIPNLYPDMAPACNHPCGHRDSILTNSERGICSRSAIPTYRCSSHVLWEA